MAIRSTGVLGILLMVGLMLGGAPAPAGAQGSFGVTGGIYLPEDDELDNTEILGIRGGYRFAPQLGIEASLSRVELIDGFPENDEPSIPELEINLQADLYNLDLSLQWFPRGGNLLVFAGPGLARIDVKAEFRFLSTTIRDSVSSEIFTAHAGLAYDWRISERFFIRPEARVRRYFDDEPSRSEEQGTFLSIFYDATDYEAAVTFGWRIGA